jgi:hypothetical protein
MAGPLAAAIRRPPCFSIRATAAASIRAGILRAGPVSCRLTLMPGLAKLYEARRSPRPITEAACWAHGRRKFFVLADLRQGPLAIVQYCIHDFRYFSHATHRMERGKERMDFGRVHGGLDNSR